MIDNDKIKNIKNIEKFKPNNVWVAMAQSNSKIFWCCGAQEGVGGPIPFSVYIFHNEEMHVCLILYSNFTDNRSSELPDALSSVARHQL